MSVFTILPEEAKPLFRDSGCIGEDVLCGDCELEILILDLPHGEDDQMFRRLKALRTGGKIK